MSIRDGAPITGGLTDNSYSDMGVENNVIYGYAVSATYSDGEESGLSGSVEVTPQAQTVHEEYHDDGTAEGWFLMLVQVILQQLRYSAIAEGEVACKI